QGHRDHELPGADGLAHRLRRRRPRLRRRAARRPPARPGRRHRDEGPPGAAGDLRSVPHAPPGGARLDEVTTMATTVETALGPVAAAELGPTLMHEHIVTRSPGVQENWPHLWDREGIVALAEKKLADLYERGIRTLVDLTTVDLGRDIDLVAAVARRSRVRVIVATGVWWMPQRYFSAHGMDAVADLFIRDIRQGIGASGIKAAIIKCATDTAGVTPVIENILRASARAQKATGVPISTHTWAAGRV